MTISNSPKASTKNSMAGFRSARVKLVQRSKRPSRKPRPAPANRLPTARANWGSESKSSARAGKWTLGAGATTSVNSSRSLAAPCVAEVKNSRKLSVRRLSAYVGLCLGGGVLAVAVLIFVFGGAILNGYGKGKVERAFAKAYPGYGLRIGELDYAAGA